MAILDDIRNFLSGKKTVSPVPQTPQPSFGQNLLKQVNSNPVGRFATSAGNEAVGFLGDVGQGVTKAITAPLLLPQARAQANLDAQMAVYRQQEAQRAQLAKRPLEFKTNTNEAEILRNRSEGTGRSIANDYRQSAMRSATGGAKSILTAYGLKAGIPKILTTAGFGGLLGGGISAATGEDIATGAGQGFGSGARVAGLTKITGPVIDKILGKTSNIPIKSLVSGGLNVLEDTAYTAGTEGRLPTVQENIASFSIGSAGPIASEAVNISGKKFNLMKNKIVGLLQEQNPKKPITEIQKSTEEVLGKIWKKVVDNNGTERYIRDNRYGKRVLSARDIVKSNKQSAYGLAAGIEITQDENGEYKVKYDPKKGLLGAGIMAGMTQTPQIKKILLDNLASAKSPREGAQIVSEITDSFLDGADNATLKAVRASLNDQLSMGEKTLKGRKSAYAEMMNNPDLQEFSKSIQENIAKIDAKLSGKEIPNSMQLTRSEGMPQSNMQLGTGPQIANGEFQTSSKAPIQSPELSGDQTGRTSVSQVGGTLDDIIEEGRKQIKQGTYKEDKRSIKQVVNDIYTQWVDRFNPIVQVSKRVKNTLESQNAVLRPENDPEYLVRRLTGAGGIADARFQKDLKPVLDQIDQLKIDKLDLDTYLANKRMAGFGAVGRDIYGADPVKAQQIVGALESKYGPSISEIANKLYSYQDKGFQEMVDAGFISNDSAQAIKSQNPDYSPLYRAMDEVNNYLGVPSNKTMQGSQPIKGIKGSTRQIESPLESIIGNTFSQRAAIEKNRVASSIVNLQKIDPSLEITPLRTAENVTKRIDIYKDIGELGKEKNTLERLMTTKNRWARTIQSELNKLNSQGLEAYLRRGPEEVGKQFTSAIEQKQSFVRPNIITDTGDTFRGPAVVVGNQIKDIPLQTSINETKSLVNDLVNSPPEVISALKKKIATRENRLGDVLDQIDKIRNNVDTLKESRNSLFDEAKLLRDAETKGKSTLTVWKNGIKEIYEVPKDIADVAKGVNEEAMNMVLKILQKPASLLRQGATGRNPEFIIPNIIRDQLDAGIASKYGYIPFVDYLSGLKSMISNDAIYQKWEQSGAKIDLGEISGKKSISKMFTEKTRKKNLGDWISAGLDIAGKYSEQPTRVGLFKKAYQKTGNELIAMMESRDSTLDFARMGSKMKVANSIIPFLNVGVQGFDKLIRSVKNNPGKVAFMMGLYGAVPQITTQLYNLQNHPQEYAEIPQYVKDSNFVLVIGRNEKGTVDYVTIPKGNITPIASNPIQSFIDYAYQVDGQSFSQMATSLLSETIPVLSGGSTPKEVAIKAIGSNIPQAVKPLAENLLNKSFYKYDSKKEQSKEIVPNFLQKKAPYEQAYDFTPVMYKKIGALLNTSPLLVQNAMEGYLAGYSKIPAQIVEIVTKTARGDEVNPNDRTILRRFFQQTYPTSSTSVPNTPQSPPVMERLLGKAKAADSINPLTEVLKTKEQNTKAMKEYKEYLTGKKKLSKPDDYFKKTYNTSIEELNQKTIKSLNTKDQAVQVYDLMKSEKFNAFKFKELVDQGLFTDAIAKEFFDTGKVNKGQYDALRMAIKEAKTGKKVQKKGVGSKKASTTKLKSLYSKISKPISYKKPSARVSSVKLLEARKLPILMFKGKPLQFKKQKLSL